MKRTAAGLAVLIVVGWYVHKAHQRELARRQAWRDLQEWRKRRLR